MQSQFSLLWIGASLAVAAAPALAQRKPVDPQAIKSSYLAQPAGLVIAPSLSGPQQLVYALPPGSMSTTTSFTNNTALAIPDLSTVTQTLSVSGAGTYLWDIDLTTNITHSWCSDLDITLTAPTGKVVSITTDNGASNANVFNGTVWDDSASTSASKYAYVSGSPAPTLTPEGAFSSLIGDNPSGTWTITISDDLGGDFGSMSSWKLDVTTLNATPTMPGAPTVFTSSPNAAITDFNTVSNNIVVSGLNTNIAEVRVYTQIAHTWSSDIDCRLTSPSGTVIQLCNLDAGNAVDAFNGTNWFDGARTGLLDNAAGNYAYSSHTAAASLVPDAAFSRLFGENPNGTWTLSIYDNASPDSGVFTRWDLSIRTYGPSLAPPTSFCTAGTTTHGCLAAIAANANPSASLAVTCVVSVSNVEGQKTGILFYGLNNTGFVPQIWSPGSTSFLCVKGPSQRTGVLNSAGTNNACDGVLTLNWDTYQTNHPSALGQPWLTGDDVFIQAWFRDPLAIKTTSLSNGLHMTYQP